MIFPPYFYKKTTWNLVSSYVFLCSNFAKMLLSISIAVSYLNKEELGLWGLVSVVLGYLAWSDLGVGAATGRLIAPAVLRREQEEMDIWWTSGLSVLIGFGILIVVLGGWSSPLMSNLLQVPPHVKNDAVWLLAGGAFITGTMLPSKSFPSLFITQDRYYLGQVIKSVTAWIHLAVFYLMLQKNFGVRSYLIAQLASEYSGCLFMWICHRRVAFRPRFRWKAFSWEKVSRLFTLSGNLTVEMISKSFLMSLPAIYINKFGSISMVPGYTFSSKGPNMAALISARFFQSFYARLQFLHVSQDRRAFQRKFEQVVTLTLSISLMAASVILCGNGFLVQLLAGETFYIGSHANMWFAITSITFTVSGSYKALLMISGSLGKHSWIVLLKIFFGIFGGMIGWKVWGFAGLASIFAFTPVFSGVYGYLRGSRVCQVEKGISWRGPILWTILGIMLVGVCGCWMSLWELSPGLMEFEFRGKNITIPSAPFLLIGSLPFLLGTGLLLHELKYTRKTVLPAV